MAGLACSAWCFAGCSPSTPTTPPKATTSANTSADAGKSTHKKGGGSHDHDHDHDHDSGHPSGGPHKGTLVVFDGHTAHLELVLDAETGTMTGYTLDSKAKNPLPIKQDEIKLGFTVVTDGVPDVHEVALKAVKPTGAGEASEFSGQSDALKGQKTFTAVVEEVKVGNKTYSAVTFEFPKGNDDHHH
jgi:hypothetical protein